MMSQQTLLNEHQASQVTGFKVSTLRKRRWQGLAPRFLKVGSKVFYDSNEIQEYLKSCVRESTSQKETR
jgi:predicted DNA-binding transcriptional regulator AlpA